MTTDRNLASSSGSIPSLNEKVFVGKILTETSAPEQDVEFELWRVLSSTSSCWKMIEGNFQFSLQIPSQFLHPDQSKNTPLSSKSVSVPISFYYL